MSYDPTERAPQPPDQQPQYGQAPQLPNQAPATPPVYGQSNPALPPYSQPTQAATPGQSNPALPPYGQAPQPPMTPAYGQSNPALPPYGQAPAAPAYGQSNPGLPPYGQAPAAPAYGQSNPSLPPYGQAPTEQAAYGQYAQPTVEGAYPAQTPVDPYAPAPLPGQPYAPGMPMAFPPAPAPKKKRGLLIAIISVILVILIVAGGVIGYIVTRPKPVIGLDSKYTDGTTQIGASGTTFNVTGTDFTANSSVTFLLDGSPAPGNQPATSDANGKVSATLSVTDAWSVGTHHLTAKDAAGYLTQISKALTIVTPGQSKTPGPNGAPTDSATGTIDATAQGSSETDHLVVTGSPNGGTVCQARDNGQPQTQQETTNGITVTVTSTYSCQGTYKGGQLSYTETVTNASFTDAADGLNCTAQTPFVNLKLQGTFSSATAVSGTFSTDAVTLNCNLGLGTLKAVDAQSGTWTGTTTMQ